MFTALFCVLYGDKLCSVKDVNLFSFNTLSTMCFGMCAGLIGDVWEGLFQHGLLFLLI